MTDLSPFLAHLTRHPDEVVCRGVVASQIELEHSQVIGSMGIEARRGQDQAGLAALPTPPRFSPRW